MRINATDRKPTNTGGEMIGQMLVYANGTVPTSGPGSIRIITKAKVPSTSTHMLRYDIPTPAAARTSPEQVCVMGSVVSLPNAVLSRNLRRNLGEVLPLAK